MESVRVTFKELMLTSSSSLPFKLYLIAKLETQARQTEEASPCRELSLFLLFVAGTVALQCISLLAVFFFAFGSMAYIKLLAELLFRSKTQWFRNR